MNGLVVLFVIMYLRTCYQLEEFYGRGHLVGELGERVRQRLREFRHQFTSLLINNHPNPPVLQAPKTQPSRKPKQCSHENKGTFYNYRAGLVICLGALLVEYYIFMFDITFGQHPLILNHPDSLYSSKLGLVRFVMDCGHQLEEF